MLSCKKAAAEVLAAIVLCASLVTGCNGPIEETLPQAAPLPQDMASYPVCSEVRFAVSPDTGESPSQETIDRAQAYGEGHQDHFGGLWVEGDELVVAFSESLEEHQDALGELLADAPHLRVVHVANSLSQLSAVADTIRADPSGRDVTALGVDILSNRVSVSMRRLSPELHAILERHADLVCFDGIISAEEL
jgi:hypothetical protein